MDTVIRGHHHHHHHHHHYYPEVTNLSVGAGVLLVAGAVVVLGSGDGPLVRAAVAAVLQRLQWRGQLLLLELPSSYLVIPGQVRLAEADVGVLQHVLLDDLRDLVHPLGRGLRRVGQRLPPAVHGS